MMEKAKSCELEKNKDDEFAGISFEELLAQEKKDSFWLVPFCSFSPSCFIKFESSWEPLLFVLEGERGDLLLANNHSSCICTGKKMGNQDYAQANNSTSLPNSNQS